MGKGSGSCHREVILLDSKSSDSKADNDVKLDIMLQEKLKLLSSEQRQQYDFLTRNTTILPLNEFVDKLLLNRPLRIKLGIDPTGSELHLGHAVILNKIREWQSFGHTVVIIVGDATARVGDPSGKTKSRPALNDDEIEANTNALINQIKAFIDTENNCEIHRNSTWLDMSTLDFFSLLKSTTLAQVMEREDIRNRYENEQPVSLLETMYPLLQGYDSVAVNADVELGGHDQLINLMMGRELQKENDKEKQVSMMMDLLIGIDGSEKMSKSLNNHIPLNGDPLDNFGRVMRIPDDLIENWSGLLGIELPDDTPRNQKWFLAKSVTEFLSGPEAASAAEKDFTAKFIDKTTPDSVKPITAKNDFIPNVISANFGLSGNEARRLIRDGAVKINNRQIFDLNYEFQPDDIIQVGKKHYGKIS